MEHGLLLAGALLALGFVGLLVRRNVLFMLMSVEIMMNAAALAFVMAGARWQQADGQIKYALSNLPPRTSRIKAVRLWKSRWPVEQGYQQMKEELGLDHHEGRSWRGFHHHACLVMLAFGFLVLEREREERDPARPGKKGVPAR